MVKRERNKAVKKFSAPWCKTLWAMSAVATAILLGVAAMPVPGFGWLRALPLAILFCALPFVVRGYTVADHVLLVRRLWWSTRVELKGLRSAQFDPEALKGSIKTCGNGGLFSFTGWFWSRRLGSYRMYVTDLSRPVVLTFADRRIVVSPDSPEAFARELSAVCDCAPSGVLPAFAAGQSVVK